MIMTNDMYMNIEMWVKNKRKKTIPSKSIHSSVHNKLEVLFA